MGGDFVIGLLVFALALGLLTPRRARRIWRALRRRGRRLLRSARRLEKDSREKVTALMPGVAVAGLRAIDGDTLEDPQSGARYRLANIDCPETDDRARCYRERTKGEQAKGAAALILASAKAIEVRPAGQKDKYGRVIAHIRVDGQDFGELMITRGFARRWEGRRESWCGPKGGLATLALAAGQSHACQTCGAGAVKNGVQAQKIVDFSSRRRRRS